MSDLQKENERLRAELAQAQQERDGLNERLSRMCDNLSMVADQKLAISRELTSAQQEAARLREEYEVRLRRMFDLKMSEYRRRMALRTSLAAVLSVLEEIETTKIAHEFPREASAVSMARVMIDRAFKNDSVPFVEIPKSSIPNASDGESQVIDGTTGDAALSPQSEQPAQPKQD